MSFENYGSAWASDVKGIASAFLCTGTFFLLFSVINSVLVLLAVNETEDDKQAMQLLQRLDLWFTLPSIYFYLGVGCGSFGFLIWFPAVLPLNYALYNIVAGVTIIALNAPYYQFLILCVYDTRQEHSLSIPGPPRWLNRLSSMQQQHKHTEKSAAYSKTHCVKPQRSNLPEPKLSANTAGPTTNRAIEMLEQALDTIGQSSELVGEFVESGWDHRRPRGPEPLDFVPRVSEEEALNSSVVLRDGGQRAARSFRRPSSFAACVARLEESLGRLAGPHHGCVAARTPGPSARSSLGPPCCRHCCEEGDAKTSRRRIRFFETTGTRFYSSAVRRSLGAAVASPPPSLVIDRALDAMSGMEQYPYPKYTWSPAGGWWAKTAHWQRKTGLALAVMGLAITPLALFSRQNHVKYPSEERRGLRA